MQGETISHRSLLCEDVASVQKDAWISRLKQLCQTSHAHSWGVQPGQARITHVAHHSSSGNSSGSTEDRRLRHVAALPRGSHQWVRTELWHISQTFILPETEHSMAGELWTSYSSVHLPQRHPILLSNTTSSLHPTDSCLSSPHETLLFFKRRNYQHW